MIEKIVKNAYKSIGAVALAMTVGCSTKEPPVNTGLSVANNQIAEKYLGTEFTKRYKSSLKNIEYQLETNPDGIAKLKEKYGVCSAGLFKNFGNDAIKIDSTDGSHLEGIMYAAGKSAEEAFNYFPRKEFEQNPYAILAIAEVAKEKTTNSRF